VRFSELDGASVGVWGAGREISSFADQLARRLPSARIVVAAFDAPPAADVRDTLRAPAARILLADADARADSPSDARADSPSDARADAGGEAGSEAGSELMAALSGCDVVVRSPGVSIYRPELRALRAAGTPVTTATSLWLAEHGAAGVIGVTGTKGKSTTAALAFHLARSAGRTARLAGNIGVPALDLLDEQPAEVTVLELSSYHTADLEIGPEVAVVTNLYREHTDWHGSEQAYRADKLRVLGLPGVRVAVLSARDARLAELALDVETIRYGQPDGWDAVEGGIAFQGELLAAYDELPVRGEHNVLNLCAALAGLEAFGVTPAPLPGALDGFQPLPHRLETVAERDGVAWVNDSISTTPESTIAALASFPDRELILIGGGQDRGQDYTQLADRLARAGATVIGVPSTGARLLAAAHAAGVQPARAIAASDMQEAVEIARGLAHPGVTVLLSPAAPSYDNYRDFEQRGERFRALAVSS
jgi:UDP-N-acetylmuramoylalanine--D-glutamate ligase